MKKKYDVIGMTCSACSAHVDKAVRGLDGVDDVNVNLLQNSMTVEFNENKINENQIFEAVDKAGYKAQNIGEKQVSNVQEDENEHKKKNLILSFIFLIPLFYISMGHMMNWPLPSILLGHENMMIFVLVQLCLVVPIMFINRGYYIRGFKTLWNRSPNMDSLIALGSSAAFIYSLYATFMMAYYLGRMDMDMTHHYMMQLYFESAGMILTLISLGKYLESRSKQKTSEAIGKLMKLMPSTALVLKEGKEVEVAIEDVQIGDVVVVKPGNNIPLDGKIIQGHGSINEAMITGESLPVDKTVGDQVIGSTNNLDGYMQVEVSHASNDTTLSKIIRLVEEAGASKAPIAKLADKISGVFVPTVITIAIITFILWLTLGNKDFHFALNCAISVLVISCPCALGLATPVAIMVGNGMGAKHGIMFKTAVSLEETGKMQIVALDKTGTITSGEPKVTDIIPAEGVSEEELLQMAFALEKKSEHPLAKAILLEAERQKVRAEEVSDFQALPGNGLTASLHGSRLFGGNMKFISEICKISEKQKRQVEALAEDGKTPLFFAKEDRLLGVIAVADVIKEESARAVKELQNMGIYVVMLTGDNKRTAQAIGKAAGVDEVIAGVLPDGKEQVVRELQKKGKVVMVGDGINDAPALTRADIGMAIGAGTDIAIDAADIVLMKSRLSDVPAAIRLSRATLHNIHENLFWAFAYNVLGIPLAAGVFIPLLHWQMNPMYGAAAMSLSSFCVVSNALRLNLFDIRSTKHDHKRKAHKTSKKENTTMNKTIKIEGMMCGHCEATVKKALEALDGVSAAEVSHTAGTAVVTLDKPVDDTVLKKAVEDKDYTVTGIE